MKAARQQTLGLVVLALIILIYILARYGRYASWSWR
jgi:hypothetical protein